MKNPALGFALLILVAACNVDSPVVPEITEEEPLVEEAPAPQPEPLTPEESRAILQDRGIPYSQASFISAAGEGDLVVVEAFVAAGMDVNARNEDQGYDTALMRASAQGHLDVVQFLLAEEANPNLVNGRCAGHLAFPDLEINAQGDGQCNRQNALMMASHAGHLRVVEVLVESGAWTHNEGSWLYVHEGPDRPLTLAAAAGHLDVVRFLVPHSTIRHSGLSNYGNHVRGGYHALMWASYGGHQEVAAYMLDEGSGTGSGKFDINPRIPLGAVRGEGYSPLMFAAIAGQTEMVRFLLDRGADIHVRVTEWIVVWKGIGYSTFKVFGASALTLAASEGHIETLRVLLDHWVQTYGADGRDDHGRTTLMYASASGDTDTMGTLVDNGAPINAKTHVGSTALMFAAAEGHLGAVETLLEMGADTEVVNIYGHTALSLAQERGHTAIAELLGG